MKRKGRWNLKKNSPKHFLRLYGYLKDDRRTALIIALTDGKMLVKKDNEWHYGWKHTRNDIITSTSSGRKDL